MTPKPKTLNQWIATRPHAERDSEGGLIIRRRDAVALVSGHTVQRRADRWRDLVAETLRDIRNHTRAA